MLKSLTPIPGCEFYDSWDRMSPETQSQLEDFSFRHGRSYDSYLVNDQAYQYFWGRERRGALAVSRSQNPFFKLHGLKGHFHLLGGLLAPREQRQSLLADFLEFASANKFGVSIYSVPKEDFPLYRSHDFQITKCGEEPICRLADTSWQGKHYAWLRRQENFCRRHRVAFQEVPLSSGGIPSPQLASQVESISQAFLAKTVFKNELGFFVSQLNLNHLGRRRLFTGVRDSQIEGFIVCNPYQGGRSWAVETFRYGPNATRGIVPFMILQAMRIFKKEGVENFSLCLAPFAGCEDPLPGESKLLRLCQEFWFYHLNWIYDSQGIYYFKSRFRPRFLPRFVATWPKQSFISIASTLNAWGLHRLSPPKLITNVFNRWAKRDSRKTLAQPS